MQDRPDIASALAILAPIAPLLDKLLVTLSPAEQEQLLKGKGRLHYFTPGVCKVFDTLLANLSEAEREQLLQGKGCLSYEAPATDLQEDGPTDTHRSQLSDEELDTLIIALRQSQTRDAARELLRTDSRTRLKANLVHLARRLQVHVTTKDTIAILHDKIVEFVVGARLRAEAIRDLEMTDA